jgi:hypothetical protein
MNGERAHRRWKLGARLGAILVVAWGAYQTVEIGTGLLDGWHRGGKVWVQVGTTFGQLLFALPLVGVLGWLAWRMWARWNLATVRIALGVGLGFAFASLSAVAGVHAEHRWGQAASGAMTSGMLVISLIVGAVVYRRATRMVSRSAGLVDRVDPYGRPFGHADRARAFCLALGWATWLAASDGVRWAGWLRPIGGGSGLADGAKIFGPMVLGWATYKIAGRRLIPPAPPPVRAGGFEVVMPEASGPNAMERNT